MHQTDVSRPTSRHIPSALSPMPNAQNERIISPGIAAVLRAIPNPGDRVDLSEAVAIVSRHEHLPYLQIVLAIRRGVLLEIDEDACVDADIVLTRP